MNSMDVFYKKSTALQYKKPHQILCNKDINKYFILDNLTQFADLIRGCTDEIPSFYEYISSDVPVNLFFDIEIFYHKFPSEYNNYTAIINNITETVKNICLKNNWKCKHIILESHTNIELDIKQKRSFHIICRLYTSDNKEIYFQNAKSLASLVKYLFPDYTKNKIVDMSVYREGLFRTFLSSKSGENRPLVPSALSEPFQFEETFVTFFYGINTALLAQKDSFKITKPKSKSASKTLQSSQSSQDTSAESSEDAEGGTGSTGSTGSTGGTIDIIEPVQKELREIDEQIIRHFVRKNYHYKPDDIREIMLDHTLNCIIVVLYDKFCHNIDREHRSNHQYIVIDTYSSKQKCHDLDCASIGYKHLEIKIKDFPKELNEIILKCLKVNKHEQELIERAIEECKNYITQNFDENLEEIKFDKSEMVFRGNVSQSTLIKLKGKCPECHVEHQIGDAGYCIKCTVCNSIFPKAQLIPVDERYKNLNTFWMKYNQLINNGTVNININNYYNSEEEFSCDIELDSSIIRDKQLLKITNKCLDGHKVTEMARLMSYLYKNYVYTGLEWYLFDGSHWSIDQKSLNFKRNILELCNLFNKIKQYYENRQVDQSSISLIKNIKGLVTKINKPQLKDDILKESQLFYIDTKFFSKLNSKKHLVPFENGVYDLLENKYRKSKKDDWINFTCNFKYDESANNREVYTFLEQVLPNARVRDYVLKKMSECLNGDIPNTYFLMFIGDSGANGKSQLLNLMKLTMGDFGEKVEVTLLTRKRNNANEANTEKIKLMNKRFAFLSEPEDGERINIGLLKELTGSEEIVARGLYQEAVSFVMEAKLFLACNELPEIKGEDTALWRRIRVIDFPSRFVDEPKEPNEFKIDRTLPSRMREDLTWRQTFINILIHYYYRNDIVEPEEVKIKTNEYRQENSDFYGWLEENIKIENDSILNLKDICELYIGKSVPSRISSKYKKEIEKYIKHKYPNANEKYKDSTHNGEKVKGWIGFALT